MQKNKRNNEKLRLEDITKNALNAEDMHIINWKENKNKESSGYKVEVRGWTQCHVNVKKH